MEINKLDSLRNSIDILDREIISLLSKRFQFTEEIGIYKSKNKINAQDKDRESEKFENIIKVSKSYGLNPDYTVKIYRLIIDIVISRHNELQNPK